MIHQRFITKLRGAEVDVEMYLQMEAPIILEIYFHGPKNIIKLTRAELSKLCREAAKHAKAKEKPS